MTQALATQEPQALAYRHELTVEEVVAQADKIKAAMTKAMDEGVHFGTIPNTPKPTLFKAGAEKLCLLFRLDPQYQSVETFTGEHLAVKSVCTLWHIPTGQRFGSGEGSCSTREAKYAWRRRDGQRVPNPDLADQYNTVLKMANKRALVAAVLNCTAASDVFTQDLEDDESHREEAPARAEPDAVNGKGIISEAQLKRFHAIARGTGWNDEQLHDLLAGYQLNSSKEIPRSQYDAIIEKVKAGPKK
jgi:hypothetical protein